MGVTYKTFDNELVSKEWYAVLADMRQDGVRFNLNEGKRTFARQQYFWDCYQSGNCNGGNVAARPSHNAPHIRTDRIDHAIDVSNDAAVFAWLRRHGLNPARTVRGESWHIEVPVADLREYYAKSGGGDKTLRYGHKGPSVVRLKKLLYKNGIRNFSGRNNSNRYVPFFGKYTTAAVKRFQRKNNLKADGIVGYSTWKALRG